MSDREHDIQRGWIAALRSVKPSLVGEGLQPNITYHPQLRMEIDTSKLPPQFTGTTGEKLTQLQDQFIDELAGKGIQVFGTALGTPNGFNSDAPIGFISICIREGKALKESEELLNVITAALLPAGKPGVSINDPQGEQPFPPNRTHEPS